MILGKLKRSSKKSVKRGALPWCQSRVIPINPAGFLHNSERLQSENLPLSLCFQSTTSFPSFSPTQLSNQVSVEIPRLNPGLNIHTSSSPKCSDPDLNPSPIPSVTKRAFSFNFVISKVGGFSQENWRIKSSVQTSVGRVSENGWEPVRVFKSVLSLNTTEDHQGWYPVWNPSLSSH